MVLLERLDPLVLVGKVAGVDVLDDGQLGTVVERRLLAVRLLFGAVQQEYPLEEITGCLSMLIAEEHLELPCAARLLGPCVCGHERPLVEAILRVGI